MRRTHDSTRRELIFLAKFVLAAAAIIGLVLGAIAVHNTNTLTNGTDGADGADGVDGADANYTETTEDIAWTGGWDDTQNRTINIVTMGNVVSIWFTEVIENCTSGDPIVTTQALPDELWPGVTLYTPALIVNTGTTQIGYFQLSAADGKIRVARVGGASFGTTSTCGFHATTITYTLFEEL
jgi:hypothetical protein